MSEVEPPKPQVPITRILRPFQEFAKLEASGGIVLMIATVVALVWANSPWSDTYTKLWQTKFTIGIADHTLSKPILLWINDGLMAIFFLLVGLEIKRELLVGELASLQQAALPIAAAVGGMVVPAALYMAFNLGGEGTAGWGIPMATDIAFALGVLALLGNRVPTALTVFLVALAIVDDIGAVLVIAFFYTAEISWLSLGAGALFFFGLLVSNALRVRHPLVYALLGLGLWVAFLKSGIHATVAGVLLATTIPARPRIDTEKFLKDSQDILKAFEDAAGKPDDILNNETEQSAVQALETACNEVQTPLQQFEHALLPWVHHLVMPIFALANAGVVFGGDVQSIVRNPVSWGIAAGLVLGKPAGILLFSWLAVKMKLATLPESMNWRLIGGAGLLGGIGFTMSIFISSLAFAGTPLLETSKFAILGASLVAGLAGSFFIWVATRRG